MTYAESLLRLVVDTSLGVWLGEITFFSFVAAPRIFGELERDRAGDVVNSIFPTYYLIGVLLGSVTVVSSVALGVLNGFTPTVSVVVGAGVLGGAINLYARQVLIPKIKGNDKSRDDPDTDAFERYHGLSVKLNGVVLVAVGVGLVASHL
ncbi:MAG: DUF4149 domain-containing protein [Halobacteria archaeon]|nr:DUF4149 domain-containing protein [Halobacteria archaeon]